MRSCLRHLSVGYRYLRILTLCFSRLTAIMNEEENNITHRYRKLRRSSSLVNISKDDSSLFETTIRSLPNSSLDESQAIIDLNDKIKLLQNDLRVAHTEIENLNCENNKLKTELEKSAKTVETYKLVTTAEIGSKTPRSGRKNKKLQKSSCSTSIEQNTASAKTPRPGPKILSSEASTSTAIPLNQSPNHLGHAQQLVLEITSANLQEKNGEPEETPSFGRLPRPELSQGLRNRIIVVGDDQGRNIQYTLQRLVGDRYLVSCFWKAGATLEEVLSAEKSEIQSLKNKDFLIILGGCNDRSPFYFQSCLANFLIPVRNTNVLISEIPCNSYLKEKKLNYELKFVCLKFRNVRFVDMKYSFEIPSRRLFALHACQNMYREILNVSHKIEYDEYCKAINKANLERYVSKGTQTDEVVAFESIEPVSNLNNSNLFRS